MEKRSIWVVLVAICGVVLVLKSLLNNVNWWLFESQLGEKQYSLPPGDLGWPFIGNMWSFLRAFKSSNPVSFISSFVFRFGHTGIYKAMMFGNPSVIVTTPETCRRVLIDDDKFTVGWPFSTVELIGKKSFIAISYEEHKCVRHLTISSLNGMEALTLYLTYIEENVKISLEKWTNMGQIELLIELRRLTFKIIMHIFLSSESESVMESLEREYTTFNHGVRAMGINLPGFAYHKALKARKYLVAICQSIVNERRNEQKLNLSKQTKDMMDALMDVEDENRRKLSDEEIIDIMIMYLNAGHESSGHITMWATVFLKKHSEYFQKAKVIDETLRVITFSLVVFREAKSGVNINETTRKFKEEDEKFTLAIGDEDDEL